MIGKELEIMRGAHTHNETPTWLWFEHGVYNKQFEPLSYSTIFFSTDKSIAVYVLLFWTNLVKTCGREYCKYSYVVYSSKYACDSLLTNIFTCG